MRIIFIFLIISNFCQFSYSQDNNPLATISFIDVGEGDSTLIRSGQQTALIDTGNLITYNNVVTYLNKNQIKHLTRVILTHPHPDHIGGAFHILQNINFDFVHDNAQDLSKNNEDIFRWYFDLVRKNKKYTALSNQDKFNIGHVQVTVLAPDPNEMTKDWNTNSLILLLSVEGTKILLMGDGNFDTEKFLLNKNLDLKSDILKVGHHGANDSTSVEFLEKIRPSYSIISVNKDNIRGYPSENTLKRLSRSSKIMRTDEYSNIEFNIYPNNKFKIK